MTEATPQQDNPVFQEIEDAVNNNDVVLFMKGTKDQPQCGFSQLAVQALSLSGVEDFKDIDVLAREEIRQGIKDFNNWPTIPQLFVKGEFVGGADIIKDMYGSGEFQEMLQEKGVVSA